MNIQQQIIGCNKSSRGTLPQYIVVHDTADPGATAQNEHDYFSGGDRGASADFFVDSNSIIQIIDIDNYYSWHCGDGHGAYGITNSNSLGIEMCLDSNGNPTQDTINNTLELVKYLMSKYGISVDRVVRHYDASRKICPESFSANNWSKWSEFKASLGGSSSIVPPSNSGGSASIATLQHLLNEQGFTDENGNRLDEDGIPGTHTRESASKCVIHRGAAGEITRWLQAYLSITQDGVYGTEPYHEMYDSVCNFQSSHGLTADGIVGPNTWSAILS